MARVTVVGAGVLGLSCAHRLLEDGHRVEVLARELPAETTSAVAAAIWFPYRALPHERVAAWGATTYAALARIADGDPGAGIRMVPGTAVRRSRDPAAAAPWWAEAVPGPVQVTDDVPPGYVDGLGFVTPVIEMPLYLPWLTDRVLALGGVLTRARLDALPTVGAGHDRTDLVVDCAGLGARELAGDLSVRPVRGQVVHLRQVGLEQWWLDADAPGGPTYVVPRSADIVVGGTDEEDAWDLSPDPGTADDVLDRARRLVPALADAPVLRHRVGLRPARPAVRLERTDDVVHCYGHGGAGVTLSWGCADEVAALARG